LRLSNCGSAAARRDPAFLIEVRILSRGHIGFELQRDEFLDSGYAKQQRRFRREVLIVVSRRQLRTIQDRAGPQPAAGKAWPDGPRLFLGDVRRLPARLHGSFRASFARSGETFFAFSFLLQFDPSLRDFQQHRSMFFRHRHCQTPTFLGESPVRCGVTHRCPPIPAWGELSRNFGFLFTKI
jgi:hypothetical protein